MANNNTATAQKTTLGSVIDEAFTPAEFATIQHAISDAAANLEDDGREGDPTAALLWKMVSILSKHRPAVTSCRQHPVPYPGCPNCPATR